jgi:hypothetical protein
MATSKYQILYWYDIPIQVRAQDDQGRASAALPDRFQVAIDNAAMAAGRTNSDAYMDTFRWGEMQERPGTAQEVAEAVAAELDTEYPAIDWPKTVEALKAEA